MTEELRSTLLYALAVAINHDYNDKNALKCLIGAEEALLNYELTGQTKVDKLFRKILRSS